MDILPAYSCLLGHPWIHPASVVPSTLHQKLKFIVNDKLIIVSGEEDLLVSGPLPTPYIETVEKALETSFQALEMVGTMYVEPFKTSSYLSKASIINKYGQALGKKGQGPLNQLELTGNKGRHELGYKPTWVDKKKELPYAIEGKHSEARWINTDQVVVIEEAPTEGSLNLVRPCLPNARINNLEFQDLPMEFANDEM